MIRLINLSLLKGSWGNPHSFLSPGTRNLGTTSWTDTERTSPPTDNLHRELVSVWVLPGILLWLWVCAVGFPGRALLAHGDTQWDASNGTNLKRMEGGNSWTASGLGDFNICLLDFPEYASGRSFFRRWQCRLLEIYFLVSTWWVKRTELGGVISASYNHPHTTSSG